LTFSAPYTPTSSVAKGCAGTAVCAHGREEKSRIARIERRPARMEKRVREAPRSEKYVLFTVAN
jgi:hypothetical protein